MREDKPVKDDLIEPSRRQFLQLGAMATAAFQLEHSALADAVHPVESQDDDQRSFRCDQGSAHRIHRRGRKRDRPAGLVPGAERAGSCDLRCGAGEGGARQRTGGEGRPEGARALHQRSPRLRIADQEKRSRSGGHRHPVELAYAHGAVLPWKTASTPPWRYRWPTPWKTCGSWWTLQKPRAGTASCWRSVATAIPRPWY